ncbi:MAG: hypothetical protein AAB439_01640 [Patescibacteria group bacterium]
MKYFLDFDRTIFDTDRFNTEVLLTHPLFEEKREEIQKVIQEDQLKSIRWRFLHDFVKERGITFKEREVEPYLFPDVLPFLSNHRADVTLVTYGNPAFQAIKVFGAGVKEKFADVYYTDTTAKGEYLQTKIPADHEFVFVDDTAEHLTNVAQLFHRTSVFEIRRDGGAGSGLFPVITSLTELETVQ